MARIKEILNLSNAKLTTTFEKKKNKAELLASLVESLVTFPMSVRIEQTSKVKRRMSTS
jgi:hypothetical protein